MKTFKGAITALATPFKNGEIDFVSVKKLIRHQLENGIEGLVVNGTTAESPCLDSEEVESLYKFVKSEVAGEVPILVGTGSNSTQQTIEKSVQAQNWGAEGLLIVTPYYNKPPQRGLVAHYKTVAAAVNIPIMLYNVPGRTAVSLGAEATIELSRVPNIIGVKDATADMELGKKIIQGAGSEFTVTSGDDFTFLDLALLGGTGVISVLSNIAPKQTRTLLDRARKKDSKSVQELQSLKRVTELLFAEANPIPVKAALHLMGIFESDEMRLPLVPLEKQNKEVLKQELLNTGLLS
jgi:4-hydroxy-tetrahydrodipicolinate synthase